MFCNVSFGTILGDLLKKFGKTPPACMKGDCENGYGTYAWEDGNIYVGEFKNSLEHGQGTYTYSDGRIDKGIWKNNKLVEPN